MFFDTWTALGRILLVGAASYVALVVFLRVSGKRTLSKWNAFDFVVTIALGSTLASALLSRSTAWAEGATGLGLLVALQFLVTWLALRSPLVARLVKSEPRLLFERGRMIEAALRDERVSEGEVRAAVRGAGLADLEEVEAVVLETDGTVSVVKRSEGSRSALSDVR